LFIEGKAAYYITGPWNLPAFQEAGMKYAISPVPAGPEVARPFMGVRGMMINAFSTQQVLAQAFLTEFWATPGAMQKFYDSTKKTPALLAVLNEIDDPDVIALGEAGKYAEPMPSIPEMASFWTSMGDAITIILQQRADPTDTFKNAAEQMRTAISNP
jgi:arabinogalactan oligomer/maltooligosaccharide transport system substrate-binding protein